MTMIMITGLPSNLRSTTRECVYLVRRGHVRSRDKNGSHTIRSATVENPMLQAHFTDLSSTESELLPIEVLHDRNKEFCAFCSCDLDADPMTFVYELGPYSLETKINFLRQGCRKLSQDKKTYIYTQMPSPKTLPCCFVGGINNNSLIHAVLPPANVPWLRG